VDEDELFAQAMGKVKPIPSSDKLNPQQSPRRPTLLPSHRPRPFHPEQINSGSNPAPEPTEDPWILRADGVSREKLKRLASATSVAGLTFDLHGLNRDEALNRLEEGFRHAQAENIRLLSVIHGRGLHSQGEPVLKEAVYRWLREGAIARRVLAVVPQSGSGGGACLVLLRRHN